jgi:hypothetical protein
VGYFILFYFIWHTTGALLLYLTCLAGPTAYCLLPTAYYCLCTMRILVAEQVVSGHVETKETVC